MFRPLLTFFTLCLLTLCFSFFFWSHRYEQNNFTFFIEFLKPDYILLNNYFEIKLLTFNTTIQFVFAFVCVNFSGFFFFFRCY